MLAPVLRLGVTLLMITSLACQTSIERLEGGVDEGLDATAADRIGADRIGADRIGGDRIEPTDSGRPTCTEAVDCAGPIPTCPSFGGCGCGTWVTCDRGECLAFSVDFCFDGGIPDLGARDSAPLDSGPGDSGPGDSGDSGASELETCMTAVDCSAPPADACFHQFTHTSCVDGYCVRECGSDPRTCQSTDTCLECGADRRCANHCASAGIRWTPRVETASCETWPGTDVPMLDVELVIVDDQGPTCEYRIMRGQEVIGSYVLLEDFTYLAHIPDLGGTCVGQSLPTGLERVALACPACTFVLVF